MLIFDAEFESGNFQEIAIKRYIFVVLISHEQSFKLVYSSHFVSCSLSFQEHSWFIVILFYLSQIIKYLFFCLFFLYKGNIKISLNENRSYCEWSNKHNTSTFTRFALENYILQTLFFCTWFVRLFSIVTVFHRFHKVLNLVIFHKTYSTPSPTCSC